MRWGTEVEQVTFKNPSPACDSVMSYIFPLFRDVPAQEVQVDIGTNGRGLQNVRVLLFVLKQDQLHHS